MKKIGLFGITANPPHYGHIRVMKEALKYCDEIWVSLVYVHPFGKKFVEYNLRLEMLKLIMEESIKDGFLNDTDSKRIFIKEIDKEYFEKNNVVPYSYDLLNSLSKENSEDKILLVIGEDNYKVQNWNRFYKYQEIEKEFGLIVINDFSVHSTTIRNELKKRRVVTDFVGKDVFEFIEKNALYKNGD